MANSKSKHHSPALWLPLLSVVALLVSAQPASAQTVLDFARDTVEDYIDRTDDLLQWGLELVQETDSGTARQVLRQAADMNTRARSYMGRGQMVQAGELAKRSRAALWHAVKLAREAMGLQERLRVRAERFRDLHQQLTERARDMGHEEALEVLRRAERQAMRAREQHLQGDMRMAWQMLEQAEGLTTRAARLLAEAGDPDRLQGELDRIEDLIDRARENLGADAPARAQRQLAEAEEALERARRHLDQGEPGRALQMGTLARRLARGAFDAAVTSPGPETVDRQLDRFDERVARLGPAVADSGEERLRSLLRQAREHRRRATEARDGGDIEPALRQIRAGHDLLNQVERLLR